MPIALAFAIHFADVRAKESREACPLKASNSTPLKPGAFLCSEVVDEIRLVLPPDDGLEPVVPARLDGLTRHHAVPRVMRIEEDIALAVGSRRLDVLPSEQRVLDAVAAWVVHRLDEPHRMAFVLPDGVVEFIRHA